MTILSKMIVKLAADISDFQEGMEEAGSIVTDAGDFMQSAGSTMTKNVTLPLVGAGTAAVHFANEFNSGMANVASLGAEAGEMVSEWGPGLQDLAVDMGKTTGDLTDGLYQVVSAVGVTGDTMEILEINSMAATAGLATTEQAIAATSAVTKGYGDTSAEAFQQASDLMLATVQMGQTTFPELASSVGRVVPLAASLGVAQEELFAVMATATGVTGSAAEVSTQYRGILQSMMAPTADMTDLYESMGYESATAMFQSEGLVTALQAIMAEAEATGTPLQKYIGSIEGQTLALALAGPQADVYTDKLAAMGQASGAVDEAFLAQTQGVNAAGFQWQQFQVQLQVIAEQIGQQLLPSFMSILDTAQPLIDMVVGLVQQFTQLDPQLQSMILLGIGLAAALGPVLMIMGTLVSSIGALIPVLGLLVGPIGLVIAAAVALGLAWANNWGGIREKTQAVIDWLVPFVNEAIAMVQQWWAEHGDAILEKLTTIWNQVVEVVTLALDLLVNDVIIPAVTFLSELWAEYGDDIMEGAETAWDFIATLIDDTLTVISDILAVFISALRGDWEQVGEDLQTLWEDAWTLVLNYVEGLWNLMKPLMEAIWTNLSEWWNSIDWQSLGRQVVDGIKAGISSGASAIAEAARSAAAAALQAAKDLLGIDSPSRVAAELIGRPFSQGIAAGIMDTQPIEAAMATVTGSMMTTHNYIYNNYGASPADPGSWMRHRERIAALG